jgi:hydroxymethylglutaryl-CoA lyase
MALPKAVHILEEGPREGFQFHKGVVPTARKIALIDALSETGLTRLQVASFVSPKAVPGWADADEVVAGFKRKPGVAYRALWLNEKGLERALRHGDKLDLAGSIQMSASEPFIKRNQNRTLEENVAVQHGQIALCKAHGVPIERVAVMAAFGCNFAGDVAVETVVETVRQGYGIAEENGLDVPVISLADTMAWGTPESIKRVVGAVRERWPERTINLHLHDTRGLGIANAYAGLEMGVAHFDAAVAGLGGCPFAGHSGAAGNVCTEDLVFMCAEMGIETGVDLEKLIAAANLAEEIMGGGLPGAVMKGGTLDARRRALA